MKKLKLLLNCTFLYLLLSSCTALSQNRNLIWCFGDSSGINFTNLQNPIPITTGMDARGSCTSIANNSGNLQFYSSTSDLLQIPYSESVLIRDASHQLMNNGDSIVGHGWYQELVIIDKPDNSNSFIYFQLE